MPTIHQGLEIDTDCAANDSTNFDTSVLTNLRIYKINSLGDEELASPTPTGTTFERTWPYPNGFTSPDEPAPPTPPTPPTPPAPPAPSAKSEGAPDTVWARKDWAPASCEDLAFAYKPPSAESPRSPRSPPRKFKRPSRGPFNKVVLPPAWEAALRGEGPKLSDQPLSWGRTPEESAQIMHQRAYFDRSAARDKRQRESVCGFFEKVDRSEIGSAVNAWAAGATVWVGA